MIDVWLGLMFLVFADSDAVVKPPPGEHVAQKAEADPSIREHLVVTAQFRPESAKETIIPVEVIKAPAMNGDRDLRELLSAELLLDVTQNTVFGSGLSIGGVSGENVQILRNGMPVVGRLDGIIDLEQLGLSAYDRVEIIKGPTSVYYGSDAMGGVVNLIPKRPAKTPEWELTGGYRDQGDEEQTLKAGFALGESGVLVTLRRRHFDGHDENPQTRNRDWAERRQQDGSFHWRRDFKKVSVSWLSSVTDEKLTDLGEFTDDVAWDQAYHTRRTSHQLVFDHHGDRMAVDFFAGYSDYTRDRTSHQVNALSAASGASVVDPAFDNAFDMWIVKGMVSFKDLPAGLEGQLGFDWSRETGSGGRILEGSQTMDNGALFGGVRRQVSGLVVQAMVRVMENSVYQVPFTPSLHFRYDDVGGRVWRLAYSRGFRGPSVKQLYLDFSFTAGPFQYQIYGNEELDAERGDHYNASLNWSLWERGTHTLELESRLFFNAIQDLIALSATVADGNVVRRSYVNVDEHRARGGDLSLSWKQGTTAVMLGVARTETANALADGGSLPSYNGRWDGRLQVRQSFGLNHLSLTAKHVGDQPGFLEVSQGRNKPSVIEEIQVPSYNLVDLYWRRVRTGAGPILGAGIKNVTDVRNRESIAVASGTAHADHQIDRGRVFQLEMGWRWRGRSR